MDRLSKEIRISREAERMGQIQEKLILTDGFTAAFTRFLNLGDQAAGKFDKISGSSQQFTQESMYAIQQLDSMRSALAAQQLLFAARIRGSAAESHVRNLQRDIRNWQPAKVQMQPPRSGPRKRWQEHRLRNRTSSNSLLELLK